ncbi:MAG: transporter [Chitinophagaceae bacterium]|nr:transporter [Chitinophagaceae bacterium]
MVKNLFLLIFCISVTQISFAQFNTVIRTGRPGQAIGAFTVGKNVLQFQQGLEYGGITNNNTAPNTFISNHVVRYGIAETVEISALVDYQNDHKNENNVIINKSGISNLHLGFRVHINNQKGILPTTGFQWRLKIPNTSNDYPTQNIGSVMIFVANWSLPKDCGLSTNWIYATSGNNTPATGKYVINFSFPIHNKWSGFIENYGQLQQSIFQTRFDGGVAYLINNNVQLDASAGFGNNQGVKDYFVSTGISWRLLPKRKK